MLDKFVQPIENFNRNWGWGKWLLGMHWQLMNIECMDAWMEWVWVFKGDEQHHHAWEANLKRESKEIALSLPPLPHLLKIW